MGFSDLYHAEWARVRRAWGRLHKQTVFVLATAPLLVFLQFGVGNRRRFLEVAGDSLPDGLEGLAAWSWWFGIQGITGFLIPIMLLLLIFRRRPAEIGLSVGDWRFGLAATMTYLPIVLVGTWLLSDSAAFQASYPHLPDARRDWQIFIAYEAMFLFYWIGWEYLWRGYVLFGTAPSLGIYAIFVQALPFALLHLQKPPVEAVLSVLGGVALGAVVWRCKSFWYAVPVHALQMLSIDFWCALRIRGGVEGKGLASLVAALQQL